MRYRSSNKLNAPGLLSENHFRETNRCHDGNTLAEYGLIAAVIAVVCLPQLINLTTSTGGQVQQMGQVLVGSNAGVTLGTTDIGGGSGNTAGGGGASGSNGAPIPTSLANYSTTNLATQIEVGGTSGGIDVIVAVLQSLASDLQSQNADPQTIADIQGLAGIGHNLGYYVGDAEHEFTEDSGAGSGTGVDLHDLNSRITDIASEKDAFNTKLAEVLADLSYDPALQQAVGVLGADVLVISQAFSNDVQNIVTAVTAAGAPTGGNMVLSDYADPTVVSNIQHNVASALVHHQSTQIGNHQPPTAP